MKKFISIRLI